MNDTFFILPVISVISLFVVLPAIIVGSIVYSKRLKLRDKELEIRRLELETERERVRVLGIMEENDERERRAAISPPEPSGTRIPGR